MNWKGSMRQQASIEMMTIYGFVLLLIVLVLGIVYILGTAGQSAVPGQCGTFGGIDCVKMVYVPNSLLNNANIMMEISNAGGAPINVIIGNVMLSTNNNVAMPLMCSSNFLFPGEAAVCWAYASKPQAPGSEIRGDFIIYGQYCATASSQLNQQNCTYSSIDYTGSFVTYSQYVSISAFWNMPTVTFSFQSPTAQQGASDPGTGTTSISTDTIQLQYCYSLSPLPLHCNPTGLADTGVGTLYYNSNLLPAGNYLFEACDLSYHIGIPCSAPYTLQITSPIVSLSFQTGSPAPGQSDIGTATTAKSTDGVAIYQCTNPSCTSASGTEVASGTGTATYNTQTLAQGTYYFIACDTTYGSGTDCSTLSTVAISPVLDSIPITLTSSSGATPNNFQQLINVPTSLYSSYINPGWTNVEFSTGAGDTGTILPAWVQSGNSNGAGTTSVWVLIPGSFSTTTIYMNIMDAAVSCSSTGFNPTITSSYGSCDDGASVFSEYANFAGGSSDGWSNFGTGTVTFNNGATLSPSTPTDFVGIYHAASSISTGMTLETYVQAQSVDTQGGTTFNDYSTFFGSGVPYSTIMLDNNGYSANFWAFGNSDSGLFDYTTGNPVTVQAGADQDSAGSYYNTQFNWQGTSLSAGTTGWSASTQTNSFPGGTIYSLSSVSQVAVSAADSSGSPQSQYEVFWVRVRATPPGGTMPTCSMGGTSC